MSACVFHLCEDGVCNFVIFVCLQAVFLNQIMLVNRGDGPKIAKQLINLYFALFRVSFVTKTFPFAALFRISILRRGTAIAAICYISPRAEELSATRFIAHSC